MVNIAAAILIAETNTAEILKCILAVNTQFHANKSKAINGSLTVNASANDVFYYTNIVGESYTWKVIFNSPNANVRSYICDGFYDGVKDQQSVIYSNFSTNAQEFSVLTIGGSFFAPTSKNLFVRQKEQDFCINIKDKTEIAPALMERQIILYFQRHNIKVDLR